MRVRSATMKALGKALIIVPTYNERENVAGIAPAILAAAPAVNILFVDDNSPDGTGQVLDEMAAAEPRIKVLHRQGKLGLGTAYIAGFKHGLAAGYDHLIEMDADFSHDPRYLPEMIRRSQAGAGLVIGSRYVAGGGTENWGIGRKIISRGGGFYARTVLGVKVRDLTAGFLCWRREVLETIGLDTIRFRGLRIPDRDEVPDHPGGLQGRRDADRLRRSPRGAVEDVAPDLPRGARHGVEASSLEALRAWRDVRRMSGRGRCGRRGWTGRFRRGSGEGRPEGVGE